jgi:hypothetical protein
MPQCHLTSWTNDNANQASEGHVRFAGRVEASMP